MLERKAGCHSFPVLSNTIKKRSASADILLDMLIKCVMWLLAILHLRPLTFTDFFSVFTYSRTQWRSIYTRVWSKIL